jgi:hypothetical protein
MMITLHSMDFRDIGLQLRYHNPDVEFCISRHRGQARLLVLPRHDHSVRKQIHQFARDASHPGINSILAPWFTVRKVKVDVEVVSTALFFIPFSCLIGPGSLRQV